MPLHTTLGVQRQVGAHFGRQRPFAAISGVERQNHACSWRSAPALLQGAFLAFKRPDAAHFGRSVPEPCSVLALNARQMLLQGVIFLLLFLIPFSIFTFIL